MFSGRRQPSCDGMSRMMREYHVRFCEGLGVKFPGPTRHKQTCWEVCQRVRVTPETGHSNPDGQFASNSLRYTMNSGRLGEVFSMFAVDARFGD